VRDLKPLVPLVDLIKQCFILESA